MDNPKIRLKAIIDACTEQSIDNAYILKMLRNMRDEWKEPLMVIECGYIEKENVPSKEAVEQFASTEVEGIIEDSTTYKGDKPSCKVTMIIEECDDEGWVGKIQK
jgi:hypothetical protein